MAGTLADQLLKKGFITKKAARKADNKAKRQRKQAAGSRNKKKVLESHEQEQRLKVQKKALEQRQAQRSQRQQERERMERVLQIRQILTSNRVVVRGEVPFFFRSAKGRVLQCMKVPEKVAFALRNGGMSIAHNPLGGGNPYVLLTKKAAARLFKIAPKLLVHHFDEPPYSQPDLLLSPRDWEPDLRAHRYKTAT